MENRLALVIAVDGLRASAWGSYGNTTFPTPLLDELASRALIVEWLLAKSPALADFYDEACPQFDSSSRKWLITDDPTIAARANYFDEVVHVERLVSQTAGQTEETHAARFFAQTVEQLAAWQEDAARRQAKGLLWVHFSGLCGPWDAPLELRANLMDEEDPLPPEFVDPPTKLQCIDDPDELLQYRVAYAAQVSVLELCIAGVVEAFDELAGSEKLAMICGTRGFSLGEHGSVGSDCGTLYSEQIHLPWLILAQESLVPLPRVSGIAQPEDIVATLCDWFNTSHATGMSVLPALSGIPLTLRDLAFANSGAQQMVRTPAWMLVREESSELYAKPDDRWEVNDVASRCPEIVARLSDSNIREQALPEELMSEWR